jgi:hypothetical protein
MAGIKTLFTGLLGGLKDVTTRKAELIKELASLREKRALLLAAPLPLDDFVDWVLSSLDRDQLEWRARIKRDLRDGFYEQARSGIASYASGADFEAHFSSLSGTNVLSLVQASYGGGLDFRMFPVLFGDTFKASLRSEIRSSLIDSWPADRNCGLSRAERIPVLRSLDTEINQRQEELDEIKDSLRIALEGEA